MGLRGPPERMLTVDQVHALRHKVLVEGRSQRPVATKLGISRRTSSTTTRPEEPTASCIDSNGGRRTSARRPRWMLKPLMASTSPVRHSKFVRFGRVSSAGLSAASEAGFSSSESTP